MRFFVVSFVSLAVSIFSSYQVAFGQASNKGKTFVVCLEGSPAVLNAQLAEDGATFNVTHPMFDRLLEFKKGETTIVPGLAESYQISKDNLKYTFKLRKGVKFHKTPYFTPTRNFNADDVIYSFNRMRLKDHPYHKVSGGVYTYFDSMNMTKVIKDIVKVDPYTVEMTLSEPTAPFLADIAMDFLSIVSEEYGTKMLKAGTPEKFDTLPVGTGPYTFLRYDKDTMVRYEANPDYFRGRPKVDKLVINITPDPSVRFQKLKTGECHIIIDPSPGDRKALRGMPQFSVVEDAGLSMGYLAMNVEKKPFDNKLVRQAINHALNRASYIDAIFLGSGQVAKSPLPPKIWSAMPNLKDYEYNPAKAKELLTKAGFPNGFTTELWTQPVSRPYNPNGKKMGEMMQADLAKVGIQVKLVTFDWPTYLEKLRHGDHTLIQMGWLGDNGDPDNFLSVLLSCDGIKAGSNYSRWCDPKFDKLINDAKATSDIKKRTQLYQKAQVLFKEEDPFVTIAYGTVCRALSKKVVGYKLAPFGIDDFSTVDLQ